MPLYTGEVLELAATVGSQEILLSLRSGTFDNVLGRWAAPQDPVEGIQFSITDEADGIVLSEDSVEAAGEWTVAWDTRALQPGKYLIKFTVILQTELLSFEYTPVRLRAGEDAGAVVEVMDGGTVSLASVEAGLLDGGGVE